MGRATYDFMMQGRQLAFSDFLALSLSPPLSELIIFAGEHYARHDNCL